MALIWQGGSLTSSVYSTTLTFPAGIFTGTVTITWTGYLNASHPRPADLAAIGHFFDVSGTYNSDGQPAEPTGPYTVTVQYTDAGKGPAIESTLAIYYWNGSQWLKEASSEVETSSNTVTAEPSVRAPGDEELLTCLPHGMVSS